MRKPDPLETRARELCLAARVPPDSRIPYQGPRTQPAWCAYRDAARAEINVRQTQEVAATAAALVRSHKYQNAPLTIVGQHDQVTLDQMIMPKRSR